MVNGCISGLASPRTLLLEAWLFPGAFYHHVLAMTPENKTNSLYAHLYTALFTPASMDMLSLMQVPLAGSHTIGRDGTDADFERVIEKLEGELWVYPLLISRFTDDFGPVQGDPDETLTEHNEASHLSESLQGVVKEEPVEEKKDPPGHKWDTCKPTQDWPGQYF